MPFSSPNNRNPDKGLVELKVRLPTDMANKIREVAKYEQRSINNQIIVALLDYIERHDAKVHD